MLYKWNKDRYYYPYYLSFGKWNKMKTENDKFPEIFPKNACFWQKYVIRTEHLVYICIYVRRLI